MMTRFFSAVSAFGRSGVKSTGFSILFAALVLSGLVVRLGHAQDVTVGYQGILNPWKVAIEDGKFEKMTGKSIKWVKFASGADVITAMAAGELHIAVAGSSPIAAGVSQGVPMVLFWILEDINDAEALVVHHDSGIQAPQDLKGKRIGVPFVSTTHFHALFALEQFGLSAGTDPEEVSLLNLEPPEIRAAWERGDLDGAFIWDPVLGSIKENGNVLITSGTLSSWGKATFDGMVVDKPFADENPDFMADFVRTIAEEDAYYRENPKEYGPTSDRAKKIAKWGGGSADQVAGVLALYSFPTLSQQASSTWLGGGAEGGAARALRFTAEFLRGEGRISSLLDDYGTAVTDAFVIAAQK